jgi:hypothetical protein
MNAIGKANLNTLKALKNYHLHDLGINIELKPDTEEKQYLESNIAMALQRELITLDDAIDIRKIGNIKLANEVLKIRRISREKKKLQHEKEMEAQRAEGQAMVAERAAQAKNQEVQMKIQAELAVVQAKSQAKMQELEKEAEVKSLLMEKEFNYNMSLQGQQVQQEVNKNKYLEDRKDSRQDKNNTQASELIQQRTFNQPAKRFESSEDNLSGSVDLSELEPS